MLLDRICIIFLGISIIFQQLTIMSLRSNINYCERQIKSLHKSECIQNKINDRFCNIISLMTIRDMTKE